jgi:myo-inositol-1(or 4)-monophosphatase
MNNFHILFQGIIDQAESAYSKLCQADDNFCIVGIGADGTETTKLDKVLEDVIINELHRLKVGGSVLSEEIGWIELEGEKSGYIFVVDPLDGTSNAKMNFPYFALSIAVVKDEQIVFGLIYNYCSKDIFYAAKSGGSFKNGRPIRVDCLTQTKDNRLVLSRPFNWEEADFYIKCIMNTKRIRMTGCPSLDVVSVASGTFNGYIDYHPIKGLIKTHDILASQIILEEAGGLLLDETGKPLKLCLDMASAYNVFAVNNIETFRSISPFIGLTT